MMKYSSKEDNFGQPEPKITTLAVVLWIFFQLENDFDEL